MMGKVVSSATAFAAPIAEPPPTEMMESALTRFASDSHIPAERVTETAAVLERMGAEVTMELYPQMGHLVNDDEMAHVRTMMQQILESD